MLRLSLPGLLDLYFYQSPRTLETISSSNACANPDLLIAPFGEMHRLQLARNVAILTVSDELAYSEGRKRTSFQARAFQIRYTE